MEPRADSPSAEEEDSGSYGPEEGKLSPPGYTRPPESPRRLNTTGRGPGEKGGLATPSPGRGEEPNNPWRETRRAMAETPAAADAVPGPSPRSPGRSPTAPGPPLPIPHKRNELEASRDTPAPEGRKPDRQESPRGDGLAAQSPERALQGTWEDLILEEEGEVERAEDQEEGVMPGGSPSASPLTGARSPSSLRPQNMPARDQLSRFAFQPRSPPAQPTKPSASLFSVRAQGPDVNP